MSLDLPTKPNSKQPVNYPSDGNEACAAIEENSFWFKSRNELITELCRRYLDPTLGAIWDVGGGNGFVSVELQRQGFETVLVEPGEYGCKVAASRKVNNVICGCFEDLKLPDNSIAAIGCFDVIEHIAEPTNLVKEFYRTLLPGGSAIVSVPAHMLLWSEIDSYSGHFLRYSVKELDKLFTDCGFKRVDSGYFFCSLAPAMFLLRVLPEILGFKRSQVDFRAQATKIHTIQGSTILKNLLLALLRFELKTLKYLRLPFGTSAFGVYRKL